MTPEKRGILISGIISHRDLLPYLQIIIDGHLVQVSMAEARTIARHIEVECARSEADAMIHRFFAKQEYPAGAGAALMMEFREFRSQLDAERIETGETDPDVKL